MPRISRDNFETIRASLPLITRELEGTDAALRMPHIVEAVAAIQVRLITEGTLRNEEFEITDDELQKLLRELIIASTFYGVSTTLDAITQFITEIINNHQQTQLRAQQAEEARRRQEEAEAEAAAEVFRPRNELEVLLVKKRFKVGTLYEQTIGAIQQQTPERDRERLYKEYYQTLGDYLLSLALQENREDVVLLEAKAPKLGSVGYEVQVYGSPVKKDLASIAKLAVNTVPEGEQKYAQEAWHRIQNEIFFWDKLVDRDTLYLDQYKSGEKGTVGAVASMGGLRQMFPETGSDNAPYSTAFWKTLFSMRKMYYLNNETREWVQDNKEIGRKVYEALRQTIARAYGLVTIDNQGNEVYSFEQPGAEPLRDNLEDYITHFLPAHLDIAPEGLYSARLPNSNGDFEQFDVKTRVVSSEIHLPFKEGVKNTERKGRVLFQLARSLAPTDMRGVLKSPNLTDADYINEQKRISRDPNYQLDNIAAVLGSIALPNITLFTPWTDRQGRVVKDAQGRVTSASLSPEAATMASRLMNYLRVVRKYTKAIETGEIDPDDPSTEFVAEMNAGLMMDAAMRPFLQHFGYDGHTFEWHILANEDPGNVDWDKLPDEAFKEYASSITHHLAPVEAVMDVTVAMAGIAKFNPETGALENADPKAVGKLIGLIRKLVDYNAEGHERPRAVQREKDESAPNYQENPTGDFIAIEVYDTNSRTPQTPVKRALTRIHTQYPLQGMHFYRWIPESLWVKGNQTKVETVTRRLTAEQVRQGQIKTTVKLYIQSGRDSAPVIEADPDQLIERELVYRFIAGLLFPGQTQAELSEKDIGVIMLVVGSLGKQMIEQRWMEGPLPNFITKLGIKASELPIIGRMIENTYGRVTREVGNFPRRAVYYMNEKTNDNQIRNLVHRINPRFNRLEKATDVVGSALGFFGASKKK